jgi:antitoxin component YwqK of YwqJK toxin-antitoxin module
LSLGQYQQQKRRPPPIRNVGCNPGKKTPQMIKLNNPQRVITLILICCIVSISAIAQQPILTKYFDSSWNKTSKDSAFFFTELVKEDTFYRCTSYWMKSKKLNCKSAYADTLFAKPVDRLLRYYENGQTADSTYFNPDGSIKNTYHYYDNGKLWVHYQYNPNSKREITDAYALNGNRMEDFIFSKEASFQEGVSDWQNYLAENVKTSVPVKKKAPLGQYQVIVRFIVGENGKIVDAEAETHIGYGMEEEVVRVIKKSPKWNPAIVMGKPVNAYRRQPITFMVVKDK